MNKIEIPYITERIYGITLPLDGKMYVVDHDEVYRLVLGDPIRVEKISDSPYAFCDRLQNCLGIPKGKEILEIEEKLINYDFSSVKENVKVEVTITGVKEAINFPIFSGDWFTASFSECGKYLLLAEPYSFELYEI